VKLSTKTPTSGMTANPRKTTSAGAANHGSMPDRPRPDVRAVVVVLTWP
jgi:hypothetical protein